MKNLHLQASRRLYFLHLYWFRNFPGRWQLFKCRVLFPTARTPVKHASQLRHQIPYSVGAEKLCITLFERYQFMFIATKDLCYLRDRTHLHPGWILRRIAVSLQGNFRLGDV
jgi:hypothetical protein